MPKRITFFSKNRTNAFLEGCEADEVFGPRIATVFRAQSFAPPVDYYVEEARGQVMGVMARFYGTVYIVSSTDDASFFLPTLARSSAWVALEGREKVIRPMAQYLGIENIETSYCMRHDGETFPDLSGFDVRKSENLRRFYEFLSLCHDGFADGTNYKLWYEDYAARIGSGLTELYFLYDKDTPVACATLNVQSKSAAVLGSVSTPPEFRGKGYGRAVSAFVTERIHSLGLTATLQCSHDSLRDFYAPLGYRETFKWAIAER